ncbi:hypothetical protein HMPREF1991_01783 [Hoylesella loescheii DSM 19665 = JCM 12249 = ATCC 15930]|uniref:Uncharacterized protein n=1 Tax=Hoylesella loescheii DSM 19665 = JCM 12249 = ATCC 15930 TaxID=1122985 RepID=A0A069QH52_HOYLO|nr:hypothetical protein HMPREF1991_01783 [Hoylesella loescheii DSM 19665 = JCM 12249 = ATCC 15930]
MDATENYYANSYVVISATPTTMCIRCYELVVMPNWCVNAARNLSRHHFYNLYSLFI